jgi:hypothetical protein
LAETGGVFEDGVGRVFGELHVASSGRGGDGGTMGGEPILPGAMREGVLLEIEEATTFEGAGDGLAGVEGGSGGGRARLGKGGVDLGGEIEGEGGISWHGRRRI